MSQLLKATSPEYAVITSSDKEPEDEQTLDLLAQYNVETYLTREGPVTVVSDGTTVAVSGA